MADAALLDVDGTLIDANDQHALAWYRAFRCFDIVLPVWRLHRHIGMGGDQYVTAVAGEDVERRCGDELRDAHSEEFQPRSEQELRDHRAAAVFDSIPHLLDHLDETPLRSSVAYGT